MKLRSHTGGARMSPAASAVETKPLESQPAPRPARYEALIRLGEAIRSNPDEKDLFQTVASELREVVEFDALCQFDGSANWVQWSFVAPYSDRLEARRLEPIPKE